MLCQASTYVNVLAMPTSNVASCCPPIFQTLLDQDDAEELTATFRALADPARLRLLSLIWSQPGAEACVCHLIEPIGLSQPTVSHHLKLLNEAGLLERDKRGAWVYYRVVTSRLEAVRKALAPHAPRARMPRAKRA
jgi:ArsR family transcriptional regulator, arsenate/arsenite/antimonite-responsive transcriptional repressor